MQIDNGSRRAGSGRGVAVLAALALLAGAAPGCGALKRQAYTDFGRRDGWQQPARVVETLRLEPGDRVADLGAGGGYFTFRLAEAVAPDGRVYAVDVDPDMLAHLRAEAEAREAAQVVVVRAREDDPQLPDPVDLVFTCNTYHHLSDRVAYFARLAGRLRPGGRIAVVDFLEGPHGTPPETIDAEMRAAGYRLVEAPAFLDRQSFRIFEPASAAPVGTAEPAPGA